MRSFCKLVCFYSLLHLISKYLLNMYHSRLWGLTGHGSMLSGKLQFYNAKCICKIMQSENSNKIIFVINYYFHSICKVKEPMLLSYNVICIKGEELYLKNCGRECLTLNLVTWLIFSFHLNLTFLPQW